MEAIEFLKCGLSELRCAVGVNYILDLEVLMQKKKKESKRTSLGVQWLRLCTSTAGGIGSTPGPGAKIPDDLQQGQKKR